MALVRYFVLTVLWMELESCEKVAGVSDRHYFEIPSNLGLPVSRQILMVRF